MRITDPDIIKDGEKDLIDAVKEDLDLDAVKQILKNRIAATALSSRGGEIVVHNNEIAFRLDFDLNLTGSLMFDRQGNYIPEPLESQGADDPGDLIPEDLTLEDIDINETLEELGPQTLVADSGEEDESHDDLVDDDLVDDDITDILQESRDFWEQKKDS